uniref:Uncharacterized protein n=1 Tax=Rhizophora mucronata TaxID=61149 RepID=A0A2P2QF49_RHIMU
MNLKFKSCGINDLRLKTTRPKSNLTHPFATSTWILFHLN